MSFHQNCTSGAKIGPDLELVMPGIRGQVSVFACSFAQMLAMIVCEAPEATSLSACACWQIQWNLSFLNGTKEDMQTWVQMSSWQCFRPRFFAAKMLAMTACAMYLIDPKPLSTIVVEGLIHPRICLHRQRWRHRCPAIASLRK